MNRTKEEGNLNMTKVNERKKRRKKKTKEFERRRQEELKKLEILCPADLLAGFYVRDVEWLNNN